MEHNGLAMLGIKYIFHHKINGLTLIVLFMMQEISLILQILMNIIKMQVLQDNGVNEKMKKLYSLILIY